MTDDGSIAGLRELNATLFDAALEGPKSLQRGDGMVAVHALDRGEMDKSAGVELQYHVTRVVRRFGLEFLEHPLDQARVVLHVLRLDLVAHQSPFHPTAPLIVARTL